jgi:hypothetical protein
MSRKIKETNCVCKRCGKAFYRIPSEIAIGCGSFCSKDCRWPNHADSLADRFFSRVGKKQPNGCILWAGRVNAQTGYGIFKAPGGIDAVSHRTSFELTNGPIPDGLHVLHHCDNRLCVAPRCLFLGTHQANMQDMVSKNRQAKGEKLGKLTDAIVLEIRRRVANGENQHALAKELGVSQAAISLAARGKNWKHV